ncbi:MAG TPA: hypothetical protein VGM92_04345 [Candidatus Kapabacteria bacterium]|jgi:hypothetical protein
MTQKFWHPCILGVLILCSTSISFAQGSAYNEIGFGTPVLSANAVENALSGGVAMEGSRMVNDINPADWTWLARARFDASLSYQYYNATEGTLNDVQQSIQFTGLSFGAPIYAPWHAALALGYLPLTDANDEEIVQDNVSTRQYYNEGGTNMAFVGLAGRPIQGVTLAARFDYLSGDIRHKGEITFADSEAGGGTFEADYFYRGVRPTFGLELIGDSLGIPGVTLGAVYSLATSLTSTYETITTPTISTLDTVIDQPGVGRYPSSFAAGLSVHLSRRYRAEADYFSQNFSSASVYSPQAIAGDTNLGAGNRISIGVERKPNLNGEYGMSFGFDRWAVRLGLSYATLPIYPTGSGGVREFSFSAGFGIPISLETMLNLSVVAGQRIPVNTADAPKETFLRLDADVSFSEQWFVPTQKKD